MFRRRQAAPPAFRPAGRRPRRRRAAALLAALAAALGAALAGAPGAARAAEPAPILDPAGIRFDVDTGGRWLLTVSGPAGFHARGELAGGTPAVSLAGEDGALPADGAYVWELRRLDARAGEAVEAVRSGTFHVLDGRTLTASGPVAEDDSEAGAEPAGSVTRAPTHTGDVTIDGRLCVGDDCTDAETMAFEAIKMKQNNTWIRTDDTSDPMAGTPFPSNDWQIKFNDSTALSAGGANYFGIEDKGDDGTSSTIPLRVDAGAPANSIRVDQNGRVGLGTATPSATLQVAGDAVVDGDFTAVSSRAVKHAFAPVEPRAVLERLVALPIAEWSFRTDPATVRHMGPVAEEFRAAFGLGRDERHVSPVDLSGVAFAAIQGLAEVVRRRDGEIAELRASRDELAARLAALEARLAAGAGAAP